MGGTWSAIARGARRREGAACDHNLTPEWLLGPGANSSMSIHWVARAAIFQIPGTCGRIGLCGEGSLLLLILVVLRSASYGISFADLLVRTTRIPIHLLPS